MRIIGITGGIGSGKSSVGRILSALGVHVIDADLIARQIVEKGQKALEELKDHFGDEIIDTYGELDRKKLGGMVFGNTQKLDLLNRITHKYITEGIYEKLEAIKAENIADYVAIEATIPLERGFLDIVDEVWVVVSDIEKRIGRVMARSGLTEKEVMDRVCSQKKDEEYIQLADRIIHNNGDVRHLENEIKNLYNKK